MNKDTNVVKRLMAFLRTIVATFTSFIDGNLKGGTFMSTNTGTTRKMRSLTALAMALAMVLSLFGGISLQPMTAYAGTAEELLTTITAVGESNAASVTSANVGYSEENVAIVSFRTSSGGHISYNTSWGWWGYGFTATVTPADGYTITKCVFYDDANRTATDSEAPFVVETTEEDKTPKVNDKPILANTSKGIKKIDVYGYATYTITKSSMTNGSVTVKKGDTEVTKAKEGDIVTLEVAPSDGYQLKDLTVVEYSLKTVADIAELKGNGFEIVSVHDGNQLGIWCDEAEEWDYLISFTAELTPSNVEEDVYTAVGSMGETWKFKFENFKLTSIIISSDTDSTTYTGTSEKSLPTVDVTQDATDTSKYTFTMPASNVTVNATFKAATSATYTVTYDVNGATEGSAPSEPVSFAPNATVTVLDNTGDLSKDDYTFAGWNTAADGTGTDYAAGDTFTITADTTLYAKWTENQLPTTQYRVIGNAMNSPRSLPSDFKEVTLEEATAYGQSFTGTVGWLIIYAKDGNNYKFVKYSPETSLRNGTQTWDNIVYGESGIYHDFTQVSIIVPYFSTYTVTLNTNGGTINSGNITSYTEGTGATLPTDVTKTNYTFDGWYADSNFTGSAVTTIGTSETGNKEFWAKWTENQTPSQTTCTITFNSKGGSSVDSSTVNSGSKVTKPTNPTRDGYTFLGWSKEETSSTYYDFDTTVTSSFTLYAQWEKKVETGVSDSSDISVEVEGLNDAIDTSDLNANQYVTSKIEVKNEAVTDVSEAVSNKVSEVKGTDSSITVNYMTIDISKIITTVNGDGSTTAGTKTAVTELTKPIEAAIPDVNGDEVFVIREHNGVATQFTERSSRNTVATSFADGEYYYDKANKKVYIYSSKFSTYAILIKPASSSGGGETPSEPTQPGTASDNEITDDIDSQLAISDPSMFLQARVKEKAKKKTAIVTLKWKKVSGATQYEVYGAPCGSDSLPVKIADTKKKSYKIKNLEWGSHHKYYVKAVKTDGTVVKESLGVHIVVGSETETNVKRIKARNVKVKASASSQISATLVLQNKGKKLGEGHTKHLLRYYVDNPSIATVDEEGKVTGVSKGKTKVYIIATNGVMKKVTVKVK